MYGKYADRRVYQHFVHTYSRVPYLDHEIFNIGERSKRLQRQSGLRATSARQGLERITGMAEQLEKNLKDSRSRREKESAEFAQLVPKVSKMNVQKEACWTPPSHKEIGANLDKTNETPKQALLGTNSTNAGSTRRSYRRYG